MSSVEKIYMSWDKFDKDIQHFLDFIATHNFLENSVILALKRGAFPSACALSNKANLPISTVAYQTRDGEDIVPRFLEPEMITPTTKIIIPDDIYDTGRTVENTVNSLMTEFDIKLKNVVGLFHYGSDKIKDTSLIHYTVVDSNHGKWVQFPWE